MESATMILSLGSNTGDRQANIIRAIDMLADCVTILKVSEIYETQPLSGVGSRYMNCVMQISSAEMTRERLNNILKDIELRCGRDDEARRLGLVPVDIDIVVDGDEILRPRDYACTFFQRGFTELFG